MSEPPLDGAAPRSGSRSRVAAGGVVLVSVIGVATNDDPADPRLSRTDRPPDSGTTSPPTRLKALTAPGRKGVPIRVVVQRLGIDVPVLPIAAEGGVLYPPDYRPQLGWYKYGARPGSVHGSAVITGHTLHTGGGALNALHDLRAGDTVRVITANGSIGYRVSEVSIISKTQFATQGTES